MLSIEYHRDRPLAPRPLFDPSLNPSPYEDVSQAKEHNAVSFPGLETKHNNTTRRVRTPANPGRHVQSPRPKVQAI